MKFLLFLSGPAVGDIIEKVKNAVLEWTIQLEAEGILGEGMQFNATEIDIAKMIPQTINYYYGNTNVISAPINHSVVVAGNETAVNFSLLSASFGKLFCA